MDTQFFPVLAHFVHGNIWTGSNGTLRYRLVPKDGQFTTQIWQGPMGYREDGVEETKIFPLTEEGLEDLKAWLASCAPNG